MSLESNSVSYPSNDSDQFPLGTTTDEDIFNDDELNSLDYLNDQLTNNVHSITKTEPLHSDSSESDLFESISKKPFSIFSIGGVGGDGGLRHSFFWYIIRYPLLVVIVAAIVLDLIIYFLVRWAVNIYENTFIWKGKLKILKQNLNNSKNYEDWSKNAKLLDIYLGNEEWKHKPTAHFYDENLIKKITRRLQRNRLEQSSIERRKNCTSSVLQNTLEIIKILKSGCRPNVGGIDNEKLYSNSFIGTKIVVENFFDEVVQSLHCIADCPELDTSVKAEFFKSSSRLYGRTCLCLSGGASLGYYHIGVVKALFENKMLPKVITGTSAGALIGALICCRTDEDVENLKRLYKTGALFNFDVWFEKMQKNITKGPMTFLEAYKKTGRILNITVVPDEPYSSSKMLNYITAPDVLISTAVIASAAIPAILEPVELKMKNEDGKIVPYLGSGQKWRDGSLRTDIPEKELHQLFDITYTIVSQTNPHVLIFFYERMGSAGEPVAHRKGKGWRGGFIASALTQHFKLDMQKWLYLLRDLSLVPRYQGVDLSDVFTQNFIGSATIVPPATFQDYCEILSDPSLEKMNRLIFGGEAATFPKLGMIKNRLKLEKALRECRRKVLYCNKNAAVEINDSNQIDEKNDIQKKIIEISKSNEVRGKKLSKVDKIEYNLKDETIFNLNPELVVNTLPDSRKKYKKKKKKGMNQKNINFYDDKSLDDGDLLQENGWEVVSKKRK
ncbi:hypothetical protein HK099_003560 [Clydaea vesicula]|uniref:Patatin-like phospholipase domain-containing protein n=1 Tax=Clydaea vesicula TaxID=447962 RepID=A0AAD5U1I1_9FUNG|nr:hypothetical protein HK099_003560 [Clydaea vesicula]